MCITPIILYQVSFTGRNGVGDISVPGVKAGDRVIVVYRDDTYMQLSDFDVLLTTNDEIHQNTGTDFSSTTFYATITRGL